VRPLGPPPMIRAGVVDVVGRVVILVLVFVVWIGMMAERGCLVSRWRIY
jgi:hypothetical protein